MIDFHNRLTVKLRVGLLMALFILLLASLGIFILQRISILHDLTETLYQHPLQVSNAALRAKTGVIRMHRSMKDVTLAENQLELDMAINRVIDDEKLVYEDLDTVKQLILGEEGKELIAETITMFTGWKPIRMEVEQLVIEGKRDAAARITRQKGAEYVAALERQMTDLTQYAHAKADGFIANARETHLDIRQMTLWIICIVSIICLVSTFLVIGGITRSVNTLQEKMAESVKTGKLQKIDIPGSNEFALLAQHFNTLVSTIKEQLWLRENLNELNRVLAGNKSLDELSRNTVSFITRAVGGCASALYLFDEKTESCRRTATFATTMRPHPPESFAQGEGIVGQVALEKTSMVINTAATEEATVRSATLHAPPACIYAVPILFDDMLLAVVEIAFMEPMTPLRKQFIDQALHSIGGMLNNTLQNTRIQLLLDASREANESLENKSSEIGEKNEELSALNRELKAQATELQSQKNELEIKRSQVEEADRLKSEFLSNMSHELRTPLNSILSLSQLLLTRGVAKDPQSSSEYIQVIDRNGRQLLSLINDILDLTKIESGRMELYPAEFSLAGLVENLREIVAPLAQDKNLQAEFAPSSDLSIYSDQDKLQQILLNLLSNAIKFTDQGSVRLEIDTLQDDVVFQVTDQGIGISPENLETIFEEFRQVDGSFTRAHDGTGLGLAISRKLAAMLGGTITVSSRVGEGSTFSLRIPRIITEQEYHSNPSAFKATVPNLHPAAGFKTILVIDDDENDRLQISSFLNENGYNTVEADSGKAGIQLAHDLNPDLISLDLMMPGMDGWETLRILKNSPETTAIPIVITSMMQEEETSTALGAAECIKKPIDTTRFLAKIDTILNQTVIESVLVIDDDLGVREFFRDILTRQGYSVALAHNGVDGLAKYDQIRPDLVILDLIMPGLDGFGFLKQLRQKEHYTDTPVIVVTSKDLTADDQQQLNGTAETFTKNNLDKQLFLDTISQILVQPEIIPLPSDFDNTPTILVVDDNDVAGEQIQIVLEEHGFNVLLAKDGEQGLQMIYESIPDGIVLDLMMPKVDGFKVLQQIRSEEETAQIPVLVLTAKEITAKERQQLTHNNVHQLIQKGATDRNRLVASVMRLVQSDPLPQLTEEPVQSEKETILIVEDNTDNRYTIQAIFKHEGFSIRFAENGKAGISSAKKYRPDLILMDIQLPDLNGIDAMKEIKANTDTSTIPVIALTAKAMKGDREELLAEGFDDYAPKPINPDELVEKVNSWLRKNRSR